MVRWGAIWGLIAALLCYWTQGRFGHVGLIETLMIYGLAGTAFGFSLKQTLRAEWHKLEAQRLEQKTRTRATGQAAHSKVPAAVAASAPDSSAGLPSVEAMSAARSAAVHRADAGEQSQSQQQGQHRRKQFREYRCRRKFFLLYRLLSA